MLVLDESQKDCVPCAVHIADLSSLEAWARETPSRELSVGFFCLTGAFFAAIIFSCFDGKLPSMGLLNPMSDPGDRSEAIAGLAKRRWVSVRSRVLVFGQSAAPLMITITRLADVPQRATRLRANSRKPTPELTTLCSRQEQLDWQ